MFVLRVRGRDVGDEAGHHALDAIREALGSAGKVLGPLFVDADGAVSVDAHVVPDMVGCNKTRESKERRTNKSERRVGWLASTRRTSGWGGVVLKTKQNKTIQKIETKKHGLA